MEANNSSPAETPPTNVETNGANNTTDATEQHPTDKAPGVVERLLTKTRGALSTSSADERVPKKDVLSPSDVAATKEYGSSGEIEVDITTYKAEKRALLNRPGWVDALKALVGGGAAVAALHIWGSDLPQQWGDLKWQAGIGALAWFVTFAALAALKQGHLNSLDAALDILEVRKRTTQPALKEASEREVKGSAPSYFDRLVDINVQNLGNYYALVRLHNDKSFVVSVWVGMFGFALILVAVGFALFTKDSKTLPTSVAAGSGVITEFIAAVFFYLYNRSVRQMRDYFQGLLAVQNVLLSLKLVSDTEDDAERAKMVSLMLSYLTREVPRAESREHPEEENRGSKAKAAKA